MRETLQLNESLKFQLDKLRDEHVTDYDVLMKLCDAEQELEELRQELDQQQYQHQVRHNFLKVSECGFVIYFTVRIKIEILCHCLAGRERVIHEEIGS